MTAIIAARLLLQTGVWYQREVRLALHSGSFGTVHTDVETHTDKYIESRGMYCRGGPPWPPVGLERSPEVHSVGLSAVDKIPRAATEGRPYSTFDVGK